MKKKLFFLPFLCLAACGNSSETQTQSAAPSVQNQPTEKPAIYIGAKAYGGIVISENNGELLIASESDLHADRYNGMSWLDAKIKTSSMTLNGYNDWRLPTINELKRLCRFSEQLHLIGFHWSSTTAYDPHKYDKDQTQTEAMVFDCGRTLDYSTNKEDYSNVRPVRVQHGHLTSGLNDNNNASAGSK